jgi:hypothetical protein
VSSLSQPTERKQARTEGNGVPQWLVELGIGPGEFFLDFSSVLASGLPVTPFRTLRGQWRLKRARHKISSSRGICRIICSTTYGASGRGKCLMPRRSKS